MTTNPLEALAVAMAPLLEQHKARQFGLNPVMYGLKHDATGTPITSGYSHGPGGLLTWPGVDPIMFNASMGFTSILSQLPTSPSVHTNPTYMTITGVSEDVGAEKEDVCDDAPTGGLMQGCLATSVFGRYERATQELELNRLGQRVDRADPMDLTLVGTPFQNAGIFGSGAQDPTAPGDLLTNEVSRKFWERNVSFHRLLAKQLWVGTPANNSAGKGYKEMTGLSVLVNTGHVDAETGESCNNMDSYMSNFNYGSISSSGADAVAALTNIYYQLKRRAELSGVDPVRWVFAMRSQMFYELSAVWPCSYLSYRCSPSNGALEFINSQDAVRFRDEMRAGKYLLIDGERVSVVLDEGIPEDTNTTNGSVASGCFSSDIYIIPMSVVGGRAVTFLEYFDYGNPSISSALAAGNGTMGRVEGAFLTWWRQTNTCVVWQSKVEPRLVLRTPWLAARLQNVVYCPVQHEPSGFPDDPYFTLEGKSDRPGPSLYSLWQS